MNESTLNIRIQVDDKGSIQIKKLGSELTDAGDKGKKAASGMDSAFSALRTTIGTIALTALGKQIIGVMDTSTQLESRLKLVTTGSENLASVQQSLYDISLRTHVSQADTIELYTRMARATEALGFSQASTLQVTETINQALIVSGATATESSAALIQLSQGIASGTLRGEEFNSVMEQTPRLARAMADGLGVNIGQLRGMAEQGQLTSEVVTRALLSQKETIDREYRQMSVTIGQAWTDLSTVVNTIIHDSDKAGEGVKTIAGSIEELAQTILANKEGITSLFTNIIELAGNASIAIVNIGQSIQGWAAVKDGRLSILEFAVMDAKEFDVWLKKDKIGVVDLDNELAALAVKRKDAMMMWNVTAEQQKARKDTIDGIDAEIAGLQREKDQIEVNAKLLSGFYTDSWQKSAVAATESLAKTETGLNRVKDAWEIYGELQKNNAKAIADAEDKIQKDKEKAEEKKIKAAEASQKKLEELDQKLTDVIIKNSTFRYEASVRDLEKEVATMEKTAAGKKDILDRIHQYQLAKMVELGEFSNMYSSQEQQRIEKIKDSWQILEETKFDLSSENFAKQKSLNVELDQYLENRGNNQLAKELARLEKSHQANKLAMVGNMELLAKEQEVYELRRQELITKHNEGLTAVIGAASSAFQQFTSDLVDGQFKTIGDAFKGLTDSMLASFLDMIAQMAANSMVDVVFGSGTAQGSTLGDLFSSSDGLLSNIDWGSMFGSPSSSTDFSGWESYDYYADGGDVGGKLQGGSGTRDDLYLGHVDGKRVVAKGGEYIMPPEQTAKYYPILESMRDGGSMYFATGGTTRRVSDRSNSSSAGLVEIFAALAQSGRMTAESMAVLTRQIQIHGEGNNRDSVSVNASTAAISSHDSAMSSSSQSTSQATEKTRDLSDAAIGLAGDFAASKAQSVATGLATAAATAALGPFGAMLGYAGMQALSGTEAAKSLANAWGEATAAAQRGFNELQEVLGFAQEVAASMSAYGESVDPQSYEVNDQSDWGGGDSSSSGSGTTGSVGSDGHGYNGESDNESGWATGGVVNRLLVPKGEDGWGALRLGEGVIDADTMKILSAAIRVGEFPGNNLGNDEVVSLLWTIASSVKKSADILTRFEYTGIPQSTREAVA